MSKKQAFLTFINPIHKDGSQGSYRLENTSTMRAILVEVRAELELTNAIKHEHLLVAQRSLAQLNALLASDDDLSVKERVDVLKLSKSMLPLLTSITDTTPNNTTQPAPYRKPPELDRSNIVM